MELGATWLHGLGTADDPNPIFAEAVSHGIMEQDPKGEWGQALHRKRVVLLWPSRSHHS